MISFLRHYKFSYSLYNFFKKKELQYNVPIYKKYGLKKKYYSSVSSIDFDGIASISPKYDRVDSNEGIPKEAIYSSLSSEHQRALEKWSDNGYAILESFFSKEEVDAVNNEIQVLDKNKETKWRYSNKIMFAIHQSKNLWKIANTPSLIGILSTLLGSNVSAFQSINFLTGSQQSTHSDAIHMTTFPNGNLIAVWIALEDIAVASGPLHFYPGSHKLPYFYNKDYDNSGTKYTLGEYDYKVYESNIKEKLASLSYEKKIFTAKKGDVLIWHANLLHGGEPVLNDALTRKSMVLHYLSDDAICYHEITQRPTLKVSSPFQTE